jgi:drug/metabolite transporter (DMT)-like permease
MMLANRERLVGNSLLWFVAAIWGGSYVLMKMVTNAKMPAGMINGWRGLVAAGFIALLFPKKLRHMNSHSVKVGLIGGVITYVAFQFGTIGLYYTTPANNAFLTATYVAMVPFLAWLNHQRPRKQDFSSVVIAIIGMVILTNLARTGFVLRLGDLLVLVSAFFYALQIVYYASAATMVSPWVMVFWVSLVQGLGGVVYSLLFERQAWPRIEWQTALPPLLAVALLVTLMTQLLQIYAQRLTNATAAGMIMMTESLFSSLFSVLLGFDHLTWSLVIGGGLLLLANLISQFDFSRLTH